MLVNIDCDRILGQSFLSDVIERFKPGSSILSAWYKTETDAGTCGTIATPTKLFTETLRGYDESLLPSGYQD